MTEYKLIIQQLRPYFAEFPYYLWGEVNYDSDGDCEFPTDQRWIWLELHNRETGALLEIKQHDDQWVVSGADPDAARAAHFFISRCGGVVTGTDATSHIGEWDHTEAMARAKAVQAAFERPELQPFDDVSFWASWKWIGWLSSSFGWVGRWIMQSVLEDDTRAVYLAIDWLRSEPLPEQSRALRQALERWTGHSYQTDQEWLAWYEASGRTAYPQPDIEAWRKDQRAKDGAG